MMLKEQHRIEVVTRGQHIYKQKEDPSIFYYSRAASPKKPITNTHPSTSYFSTSRVSVDKEIEDKLTNFDRKINHSIAFSRRHH